MFYLWTGCMPDAGAAFYFSGITYTTVGYGDVVLAKPWRLLGPIEGLMGILMLGLSTGYLFAVMSHVYQSWHVQAAAVSTRAKVNSGV
ncbi:MAG: potassium channel family protein [Burkholderiales bacterium]